VTIDVGWALSQLQQFISLDDLRQRSELVSPASGGADISPEQALVSEAPIVEQILDRVSPTWRSDVGRSPVDRWRQRREAARRAVTLLSRAEEIRQRLGDDAPTLDAGRLHPWAWEGARSMWRSRHYNDAVVAALKKLNAEAQNKTERYNISETDLFKQLFSTDAPKPGAPRLRLMNEDGSDTYKSVHRGAWSLAEGLFAGIRNVVAHTVQETAADEQRALEQLAAVSVLARWVDDARVVTAP
jgi:hypothetical protein